MSSTFDPLEYWQLALSLTSDSPSEAQLRCAVGRAYYAMFLVIRRWIGITDREDAHLRIRRELNNRKVGALASDLSDLKKLREMADYDLAPTGIAHADWAKNWALAERITNRIISRLKRLGVLAV